jgi:hypothetical protein
MCATLHTRLPLFNVAHRYPEGIAPHSRMAASRAIAAFLNTGLAMPRLRRPSYFVTPSDVRIWPIATNCCAAILRSLVGA